MHMHAHAHTRTRVGDTVPPSPGGEKGLLSSSHPESLLKSTPPLASPAMGVFREGDHRVSDLVGIEDLLMPQQGLGVPSGAPRAGDHQPGRPLSVVPFGD